MGSRGSIRKKVWKDITSIGPGLLLCGICLGVMAAILGAVCPLVVFLGLPCPGCGLSRAAFLLAKGDVAGSFYMHPMLLPLAGGLIWLACARYFSKEPKRHIKWLKIYLVINVFLFVVVYMVRMKLFFPCEQPMVFERNNVASHLFPGWGENWIKK